MKTMTRVALLLVLVSALALVIAGCSSGSPPTAIPRAVTGTVKNLDTDTGVQGVTVTIGTGAAAKTSAVTGADGVFTVTGVLAPQTYTFKVDGLAANMQLATSVNTMDVPVPAQAFSPVIYVVPKAPDVPVL
jgi:hypothetical protein